MRRCKERASQSRSKFDIQYAHNNMPQCPTCQFSPTGQDGAYPYNPGARNDGDIRATMRKCNGPEGKDIPRVQGLSLAHEDFQKSLR